MSGLTPSQTVGPFFRMGLVDANVLVPTAQDLADEPHACRIEGRVLDGAGQPVPDAVVEILQADAAGRYDALGWAAFGRSLTDVDGRYFFLTVKPGVVRHDDGTVQAPHLDVSVLARGLLQRVATRLYFPDEAAANAADPVLSSIADEGSRSTLVAVPVAGVLRFDVHLQGAEETAFFEL